MIDIFCDIEKYAGNKSVDQDEYIFVHGRIISGRGEKARKIPPRSESKYLKN